MKGFVWKDKSPFRY